MADTWAPTRLVRKLAAAPLKPVSMSGLARFQRQDAGTCYMLAWRVLCHRRAVEHGWPRAHVLREVHCSNVCHAMQFRWGSQKLLERWLRCGVQVCACITHPLTACKLLSSTAALTRCINAPSICWLPSGSFQNSTASSSSRSKAAQQPLTLQCVRAGAQRTQRASKAAEKLAPGNRGPGRGAERSKE